LHARRAVTESSEDPAAYPREPDIVLKLSGEAWAKVYFSAEPVDGLTRGGERAMTAGDAAEAARVSILFDRYDPARAVVAPSTSLMQDHVSTHRDPAWIKTVKLMRDKKCAQPQK
jgi:hypothetical protein